MNKLDSISYAKAKKAAALTADLSNKQWNDFFHTAMSSPWQYSTIANGTNNYEVYDLKHGGVYGYMSSSSANSGRMVRIDNPGLYLSGGESTTIIFKTAPTLTGVTRRMGFVTTSDQSDCSDGVYLEIIDGVIKGKTANNNTRSVTETTFTLTADTWYRLKIVINTDITRAQYTLYADDSITVLWDDTLSLNIPKTRGVAHGDVCTYSGNSAILIGSIDYMDIIIPNARRIV
jgi:hypothetical protein